MEDKIRVLYDYQAFHMQRFGGISRYFYELACNMRRVDAAIDIRFSMNQYIRGTQLVRYTPVPKRAFKIMEGVFRKINRSHSLHAIRRGDFDVFHPTYYHPYFLEGLGGKPFVLTIHDMTHERFPQYFAPNDPTPHYKRLLAARAARIIAISECTKRDVMELLHVPEERIDVIYHGLNAQPLSSEKPLGVPSQYVLYVGERRGYKNFGVVAEAFARLAGSNPELHLVLTGRPLSAEERELFIQKGIAGRVTVMSDVSDRRLASLYRNARLFVYPSLYEGFGVPILEAFAQRCPVVLSQASCFEEVAADAAVYFDPESADELEQVFSRLLSDSSLCHLLAARGAERLKGFAWEKTARETEQTYMKVLADL